ncbi:hypothetical protein HDU76_005584 [Blyttiomyces sp. JEL0837]|nr:hypothetical protein HDU76_005584 [Blyttiomyces sp. JEL0837]
MSAHVQRLAQSLKSIYGVANIPVDVIAKLANLEILQSAITSITTEIVREFGKVEKTRPSLTELKDNILQLSIHCDCLVNPPYKSCHVAIHGAPRQNPTAKDTQWIIDRKPIEDAALRPGIHEVILADQYLNLYEGLTTNFFCIIAEADGKNTIITPSIEHVLRGTMTLEVEQACRDLNIGFRYAFPNVLLHRAWIGAFITSRNLVI